MEGYQLELALPTEVTWLVGDLIVYPPTHSKHGLTQKQIVPVKGLAFMQNCRLYLTLDNAVSKDVTYLWGALIAVETLLTASRVLLVNKELKIPGYPDATLLITLEFN